MKVWGATKEAAACTGLGFSATLDLQSALRSSSAADSGSCGKDFLGWSVVPKPCRPWKRALGLSGNRMMVVMLAS